MKISIIIAAYNVEKYIEKCIDSCLVQGVPGTEYEVIAVNDASTDTTLSILNGYAGKIKIVNHESNKGLGASRNSGLAAAKGNYIWFIDGDDFIERNALTKIFSELSEKDLDGLVIDYATTDEDGNILQEKNYRPKNLKEIVSGSELYFHNFDRSYSVIYIFKNKIYSGINFKEKINMQDSEILPKLLHRVKHISFIDAPLYFYVQHETSFTNSANFEKRYRYFQSIIEVRDSLREQLQVYSADHLLTGGIRKKLRSIDTVFLSHLLYFPYEKESYMRIINLLRQNSVLPLLLQQPSTQYKILALCINIAPWHTYTLFSRLRNLL